MEDYQFPRKPIDINYGATQGLRNRPRLTDADFVGSFREELIKDITAIKCSQCEKNLMNNCKLDASPMTGYCGHLFCFGCATFLFQQNNSARPPNEIQTKDFEVHCDQKSFLFYYCRACNADINFNINKVEWFMEKRNNFYCYSRLFEVNSMLSNLYDALRQDGYLCHYKDNVNWKICHKHPLSNSLHCDPCRGENENKRYTCVWHAETHMKCEQVSQKCGLQIMAIPNYPLDPLKVDPFVETGMGITDNHLATPDRTKRHIYAAFYHCAYCGRPLQQHVTEVVVTVVNRPFHLPCGHLVGVGCEEDAWNQLIERAACCIFCKVDLVRGKNVKPIFPPIRTDVMFKEANYRLKKCNFDCKNCDFSSCKTLFPPRNNQFLDKKFNICQWCEVEHQLLKKDGLCSEKPSQ